MNRCNTHIYQNTDILSLNYRLSQAGVNSLINLMSSITVNNLLYA